MPIPGPRTQFGPNPGYRNPENRPLTFFNQWDRPGPVWWPGRSPGYMRVTLRGCRLAAGQVRRFYRQSVNLFNAAGPYSWTRNDNDTAQGPPVDITRALRYKASSTYLGANDNSRYAALHTVVKKTNRYKTVTVNSGQKRYAPTVRNRLTSFGSRVPTLNQQVQAAEEQTP